MLGRDFQLINYEFDPDAGGASPYADGDWVETDESPQTVSATIDIGSEPTRDSGGGSGVDVEHDAVIYLLGDDVTIRPGTSDEQRATEFVDTSASVSYRAVAVEAQLHLTAVHVAEL